MWKGIDVSDNQGAVSWNQVKEAGCQFAVLRSVRRSGKPDAQFGANVSGCRANGIPFEVYKYTYADVPSQAAEEAKQEIADAQAEIDKIENPKWYIQDRSSALSEYDGYGDNADRMRAIGQEIGRASCRERV